MPKLVSTCKRPPAHGRSTSLSRAQEVYDLEFSVTVADPTQPDCPLVACSTGFTELTGYSVQDPSSTYEWCRTWLRVAYAMLALYSPPYPTAHRMGVGAKPIEIRRVASTVCGVSLMSALSLVADLNRLCCSRRSMWIQANVARIGKLRASPTDLVSPLHFCFHAPVSSLGNQCLVALGRIGWSAPGGSIGGSPALVDTRTAWSP